MRKTFWQCCLAFLLGVSWLLGLAACSQGSAVAPILNAATTLEISATPISSFQPKSVTTTPVPVVTNTLPMTVVVHTPTTSPTPVIPATPTREACLDRGGQVRLAQIETEILHHPLDFRVYTPPCYTEHTAEHYPALYLIHGQSFNDDQWDRLGVNETADRLIAAEAIPPLIIIMPRDRFWTQPSEDPFGKAVIEVLIPWVDRHYRTHPDRASRAIGGLSRGGSWALHLGTKHWQFFSAIGGHSAPIFWEDASTIRGWLEAIPPDEMPRFYLDLGNNDRPEISDSTLGFERLLTRLGIPHEFYLFQGYHEEAYWSAHVEQYLRWYTAAWK